MTSAIFPGSFDPLHNGHVEVVERAHKLFERVIVAVLRNTQKGDPLFPNDQREALIKECFSHLANVEVVTMQTLVVDVAKSVRADVIIRGLRAVSDFENELQMAQMNQQLSGIETLFIPTGSTHSFISSRLIREIASFGGNVGPFVPDPVLREMKERLRD
jgi:pantetheine-phosphate adenylyltransferase